MVDLVGWGGRGATGLLLSLAFGALIATAGCSSGSGGASARGGAGGTAGTAAGGTSGGGTSGGGTGAPTDAGTDVYVPPQNPLCPRSGPVVQGATPLPDGVEIVAPATGVRDLVVAGGFVYWTTQSTIQRVPVTGGSPTMLLDRSSQLSTYIGWVRVDGDTLYFTEVGKDQVAKMPADGSAAPTTIATGNSPWQLVVAGGYVYYYDAGPGEIGRVPVAGGTPTKMVSGVSPADHMVVANNYLYWVDPRSNSFDVHLLRVPVTATAPPPGDGGTGALPAGAESVVATDNYDTYGVTADGTWLYWDEDNKVMRAPQMAGATSTPLDQLPDHDGDFGLTETTYVGSVVVDNGSVFWNSELGCGDIFKAGSDGTGKATLVHAVASPSFLAVDATHVFFLAAGAQILRAPR